MTNEELNKLPHEKVMEGCWHSEVSRRFTGDAGIRVMITCSCGVDYLHPELSDFISIQPKTWQDHMNPSYTNNPADYWRLLQKVRQHRRFMTFMDFIGDYHSSRLMKVDLFLAMLHGCEAIAEFFCKEIQP
jgi:hypothetical protein